MIPKIIHYCWFGENKKPQLAEKCIASWRKLCPDYEIREWSEDNFDLNCNEYVRFCAEQKKWAFLSDYVRLAVVAQYGGVYLDTDVELLKRPDELLRYGAYYGFENDRNINTGLGFGAEAGHPTVLAMKQVYENMSPESSGAFPTIACPALNTQALLPFGLNLNGMRQNISGAEVLPVEYLNPYDDPTGRLNKTKKTISIHWYSKSWMNRSTILRSKLTKPLHRIFGVDFFRKMRKGANKP